MQSLLSEISFVIVTDLLPKKSYKNTTQIGFPIWKKYLPIQLIFPFLFDFLSWMSFLSKRAPLGASFDLKYSNNLIRFLINIIWCKVKINCRHSCNYVRLRYAFLWQFKAANTRSILFDQIIWRIFWIKNCI